LDNNNNNNNINNNVQPQSSNNGNNANNGVPGVVNPSTASQAATQQSNGGDQFAVFGRRLDDVERAILDVERLLKDQMSRDEQLTSQRADTIRAEAKAKAAAILQFAQQEADKIRNHELSLANVQNPGPIGSNGLTPQQTAEQNAVQAEVLRQQAGLTVQIEEESSKKGNTDATNTNTNTNAANAKSKEEAITLQDLQKIQQLNPQQLQALRQVLQKQADDEAEQAEAVTEAQVEKLQNQIAQLRQDQTKLIQQTQTQQTRFQQQLQQTQAQVQAQAQAQVQAQVQIQPQIQAQQMKIRRQQKKQAIYTPVVVDRISSRDDETAGFIRPVLV